MASTYARLAAVARGTREDWLSLLYIADQFSSALRKAGFEDMADESQAEAVAIAENMVEAGDEEVALMIVASADEISPIVMALAVRARNRVRPDARLLPEGDHLHTTFPGWYGAPVLGGAAKAGLRNPNARP